MIDKIKLTEKQRAYAETLAGLSDHELYEAVISAQMPDDYDGAFTDDGLFEQEYSDVYYHHRMGWPYHPDHYSLFNDLLIPKGMSRYEYMNP